MRKNAKTINKQFQKSKNIALFGHINPDGDCIGSMLGLGKLLEKQGKKVSYFVPTPISRMYNFLPCIKRIKTIFDYKNYDLLVFVDFSSYGRIAPFTENKEYFDNKKIIVFDHHPENTPTHSFLCKDIHIASCTEIIFEYSEKYRKKYLDKDIATYLYMGLATDSGNFLFDQDHERIFRNALSLVRLGADKELINNNIFRKKSLNQIQFLEMIIKRIKIKGELLYSYYQKDELKKYGIDQEEATYGLTIIQNIAGPRLTLMIKKISSTIQGSLRSNNTISGKKPIDCNIIAKQFNGGGHTGAAGFTIPSKKDFPKQLKDIVMQISKYIQK